MIRYAIAGLLAIFMTVATNAEVIAGQFDSTWKYSLNSKSSNPQCRGFGSGTFKIENGKFSDIISHDQDVFRFRGEVSDGGKVNFKANGNYASVSFDINFIQNSGSGTWVTARGCDGTIELTNTNPQPVPKKQTPSEPSAQVVNPVAKKPGSATTTSDIEERLKKLDTLLKAGLITESEAAEKRKEILKNL